MPDSDPPKHPYREFVDAWKRLAREGRCDAPGGAEWRRVLTAWYGAGQVEPEPFILRAANVGPAGRQGE